MVKHSKVAAELIGHAKNGMLSLVAVGRAIQDLIALEPFLVEKLKSKKEIEKLTLSLNRGLRTLLTWYRVYKMNRRGARKQLLKGAAPWEESVLDGVAEALVLSNKELKVGLSRT